MTTRLLLVALLAVVATIATAGTGPYVALSPYGNLLHLNFDYDEPGTGDAVHPDDTLAAWAMELGWRVSPSWSLALERLASADSEDHQDHEYNHLLLRVDWFPTAGNWWLGSGIGFAGADGLETVTHWGGRFVPSGGGFAMVVGAGAERPLSDHWAVRGRLDFVRETNLPADTTDRMDVHGWRAGLLLVWCP